MKEININFSFFVLFCFLKIVTFILEKDFTTYYVSVHMVLHVYSLSYIDKGQ